MDVARLMKSTAPSQPGAASASADFVSPGSEKKEVQINEVEELVEITQ